MDACTTIDVPTPAAESGEDGCRQPPPSDARGPYWTVARTFSFCHHCGKPVQAGAGVLRFAGTEFEYCYRANCGELQWIATMEAEDEARERDEWARLHAPSMAVPLRVE